MPTIPNMPDSEKFGTLLTPDMKLYRQFFDELVKLQEGGNGPDKGHNNRRKDRRNQARQREDAGIIGVVLLFGDVHARRRNGAAGLQPHEDGQNLHPGRIQRDDAVIFRAEQPGENRHGEKVDAV